VFFGIHDDIHASAQDKALRTERTAEDLRNVLLPGRFASGASRGPCRRKAHEGGNAHGRRGLNEGCSQVDSTPPGGGRKEKTMKTSRRRFLQLVGLGGAAMAMPRRLFAARQKRPNVLWISLEDIGPELGCYGDDYAISPNIDKIAAEGVRYEWAFTHAPVCAPARCGIITGVYPITNGGNNMRCRTVLPPGVRCFPEYLREAGYYCSNHTKTDYQFGAPAGTWDRNPRKDHWWRSRKEGQPFFVVVNLTSTHESRIRGGQKNLPPDEKHDPAKAKLPAYHPDTPVVRQAWANYYDNITATDKRVGDILKQLDEDGLAEETIVFFWGDHGSGMTRGKRWIYDSGTRVPILVRVPDRWRQYAKAPQPGTALQEFAQFLDFAPSVLSLAGVKIPDYMQGRALLGPQQGKAPEYVFAFRDRMDERYDMIRMTRDHDFMYIRNFRWWRPHSQLVGYMRNVPSLAEMWRLHRAGKLNAAQSIFFAPHKPKEELYDVRKDPGQVHNLADDPAHAERLATMRKVQQQWQEDTGDLGFLPEPIFDEIKTQGDWRKRVDESGVLDRLHKLVWPLDPPGFDALKALLAKPADILGEAVRYWAIVLMHRHARGEAEKKRIVEAVTPLTAEPAAPCVRVAAAEAAGELGGDLPGALDVLVGIVEANGKDANGTYAVAAIERLGKAAAPIADRLRKAKVSGYAGRLVPQALAAIEGTDVLKSGSGPKKPRNRNRAKKAAKKG